MRGQRRGLAGGAGRGRRIAIEHPNARSAESATLVERAVRHGDMVVIDGQGELRYSNDAEPGQTGEADDPARDGGGGNAGSSAGSTRSGTASGGSVTGSAGP